MKKYYVTVQTYYNTTLLGYAVGQEVLSKFHRSLVNQDNVDKDIKDFINNAMDKHLKKNRRLKPMLISKHDNGNSFVITLVPLNGNDILRAFTLTGELVEHDFTEKGGSL
ncbi:hypothetical protein [uncultured Prevotella sp.]|uniref:hypothetical protein n=1 Tax=uncultured Prevotella sp. TaxID=159272 RepID=UPI002612640F|nr:hypothetical protein [uncultured Prevotella sp.]